MMESTILAPPHRHVVVVTSSRSFSSSLDPPSLSTSISPFPSPPRRRPPPTPPTTHQLASSHLLLPSRSPPKPPSSVLQPSSPQLFQSHLRTLSLVLTYLNQNLSARSAPGVAWALEELCRLDGRVAAPVLDVLARLVQGEGGSKVGEYVEWAGRRFGEGIGMLRIGDGGGGEIVGWERWVEREVDHLLHNILETTFPKEQKALLDVLDLLDPETAEEVHAILFSTELYNLDDDGERRIRLLELSNSYSFRPSTDRPYVNPPPDLDIAQLASLLAPS